MAISNCMNCGKETYRRGTKPAKFCSRDCSDRWARREIPGREWLYQKYIIEGLSANEIAVIVNRNSKRVWEWLKQAGIPTRPRGSYEKVHFKKGAQTRLGKPHSQEVKDRLRQARREDGHVPYLKNGVHHLRGKKGQETPNWKGGVTPERQSFYGTEEWKKAVKIVWKRDNAICQRCGLDHRKIDRNVTKFHIHHIVSFQARELRCDPSNLVLLCHNCHLFVHSRANTKKEFIA
jgi:transposase